MTTVISFNDGTELAVANEYLHNSKSYLDFIKHFPAKTWICSPSFPTAYIKQLYESYDNIASRRQKHPYMYWHELFRAAEFLEDDYALAIIRDQLILTLQEAYPKECQVEIWLGSFCLMQFRCLKRPVIIARELAKLIKDGLLCVDYIASMMLLSDIPRAEVTLGQKNSDITACNCDCYDSATVQDALRQRIASQLFQYLGGLNAPNLVALTNLLKDQDLSSYVNKEWRQYFYNKPGVQNGIFREWYREETLAQYLDALAADAIAQPDEFLRRFNYTQAVMYSSSMYIQTCFYTVVIDGQAEHPLNRRPGLAFLAALGHVGVPGPVRGCALHTAQTMP